jgi:hypothetical protein
MKIINTNYGELLLYFNENNKINVIKLKNNLHIITLIKSYIDNKECYEIKTTNINNTPTNNGLQYYSKNETTSIKNGNLNYTEGVFHLVYDYNEYCLDIEDKLKVRYFMIDKKYNYYLDLMKGLNNNIKYGIIKNLVDDLYGDIRNNMFISLLDICEIKNSNTDFNKSNIKDKYQNIILEKKHIDLNKLLDTDFLLKVICDIEDIIKDNINQIFIYFENNH